MKNVFFILLLIIAANGFSQSLDVDQTSQFLKPRLRLDTRYFSTLESDQNNLHFYDAQLLFSAPIHTRVKSNLVDVFSGGFDLKKIKDEGQLRFSQQMLSAKVGYKNLYLDTSSVTTKDIYSASIGLFGLQSLKKLNILFYSVNANFSESSQSLEKLRPGFSGIIGDVKIKGLKKYYVYGLFAAYVGNRFIACPFFGANLELKKHHYLNFVLPAYFGYNYSKNNINNTVAIGFDGFRTGLLDNLDNYTNLNMGALSLYNSFRYKMRKGFWLRFDAGLLSRGVLRFNTSGVSQKFNLPPGYYFTAGVHYNFGSPALKQINLLDLL
ncbi:MAG TPA: hypothetical protein VK177_17555 [Flavobacteriales bacterium]|nr:hypothetical protein [Flavobacteriales bacterium]